MPSPTAIERAAVFALLDPETATWATPLAREVAGVLNWTPPRLSLVKSGLCRMTPEDMQKLAEWAGVDMESLATSEDFAKAAVEAARQINY